MKYIAKIKISLRQGYSDPEGETTRNSLMELSFPVREVKISKFYEILFESSSLEKALEETKDMCNKLLTNPIKDDYFIEIEESK